MGKFTEELNTITDPSIQQIAQYLLSREDIKHNLEKENKTICEMWKYIVGEMYKDYTSSNGLKNGGAIKKDNDIYSLAVHYYDEDDIEIEEIKAATVKNSRDTLPKENITNKSEQKKIIKPKKDKHVPDDQISLWDTLE